MERVFQDQSSKFREVMICMCLLEVWPRISSNSFFLMVGAELTPSGKIHKNSYLVVLSSGLIAGKLIDGTGKWKVFCSSFLVFVLPLFHPWFVKFDIFEWKVKNILFLIIIFVEQLIFYPTSIWTIKEYLSQPGPEAESWVVVKWKYVFVSNSCVKYKYSI